MNMTASNTKDAYPSSGIETHVIAEVIKRTPGGSNHRIVGVQQKFLKGSLYTVSFEGIPSDDGQAPAFFNRVYVHGKHLDVYGFDEHLLAIVGATHDTSFWSHLTEPKSVAAIIAVGVTLLLAAIASVNLYRGTPQAFPEFLTSGFLLILGFYFGKSVGSNSRDD